MIVGVLTTCHTQYTWDSSICIFLFNRTTLQFFVTYLTGTLYVHPLWFYKHKHDNRVRSIQNAFSLPFAAILVNCAPSGEMHNYCTPHVVKENYGNFLIHRCNYILLSQVYCVWQVVKTPTIILNNPVQVLTSPYSSLEKITQVFGSRPNVNHDICRKGSCVERKCVCGELGLQRKYNTLCHLKLLWTYLIRN